MGENCHCPLHSVVCNKYCKGVMIYGIGLFFHSDYVIMYFKTILDSCLLMSHFDQSKSDVFRTKNIIKKLFLDLHNVSFIINYFYSYTTDHIFVYNYSIVGISIIPQFHGMTLLQLSPFKTTQPDVRLI